MQNIIQLNQCAQGSMDFIIWALVGEKNEEKAAELSNDHCCLLHRPVFDFLRVVQIRNLFFFFFKHQFNILFRRSIRSVIAPQA